MSQSRKDRHHRKPRSRGGKTNERNIIRVERNLHEAWHLLVGNATAEEAARILSHWIDPDFVLIAVRREK